MLHEEPLCYNRPDGAGLCADGDSGEWTGEKRRKHLAPSPPCDTSEVASARISSSSSSDGPGGKKEPEHIHFKAPWEKEEVDSIGPVSDVQFREYEKTLSKRHTMPVRHGKLDLEQQRQVYQRLVLYRIRAHKLWEGESIYNLGDEALRKELPVFLRVDESILELDYHVAHYFYSLEMEEGGAVDWYFDTAYAKFGELNDYQRLVVRNSIGHLGCDYWDWAEYHSKFTTYEMDQDYVKFCEVVSSKLKWPKPYVGYPETSVEWSDMYIKGLNQAFKIASEFSHVTSALAYAAYGEHIRSMRFDYFFREDMDRLFFEIWKRVTSRQLTFAEALGEVLFENLVPRHQCYMQYTLEDSTDTELEGHYNSCVDGIPNDASEDVAKGFIIEAVLKRHKVRKSLQHYMARKMEIAESIGLVNRPDVSTVISHPVVKKIPVRKERYVIPARRLQL